MLRSFTIDDNDELICTKFHRLTYPFQVSSLRHGLAGLRQTGTITTCRISESFLDGIGLVESLSRNVKGKYFFVARTIDTGIGGPFISRANTNNVSVGAPFPARLGARLTVPLIAVV